MALDDSALQVHCIDMAVKTITIDLEAYQALARNKQPGQSFSQVIKEHFSRQGTGRDLTEALASIAVSEATLKALDEIVAGRERDPAQAVDL